MKARLLKKLRKKYSSDYKILKESSLIGPYSFWTVYKVCWDPILNEDCDRMLCSNFKTEESALNYIRNSVRLQIGEYIEKHRKIKVTSKMLYG